MVERSGAGRGDRGVSQRGVVSVVAVLTALLLGFGLARTVQSRQPWASTAVVDLPAEVAAALRGGAGAAAPSPLLRLSLPGGLPTDLDVEWSWRIGEGDWLPVPIEGTDFLGAGTDGEGPLRTVPTGRLDGTLTVESGFGGGDRSIRGIDLAVALHEVDGRSTLRPWMECRLSGPGDGADRVPLHRGARVEPLALPEQAALPRAGTAVLSHTLHSAIERGRGTVRYELAFDGGAPSAASGGTLHVRLTLSSGGLLHPEE